jgi:anaerobic ribonucleoside-triphosphate reductase
VPYTPQQNMPLKFWAEVVNTTSYLLNRMTTKVYGDKTPYEIWYGFKPNVDHLKVFGSPCYVLQPEVKRRKLDQKADMGILIGYSIKSKAYKIYNLKSNKVVIARNVKVADNGIWNWEAALIKRTKQEYQIELDAT